MSWDFSFVMPCCGIECADGGNLTYNLHPMMDAAGIAPRETLDGKHAPEVVKLLGEAWDKLIKEPEKYKKFNPANGWGSYGVLINWIQETVDTAERYPDSIFKVQ